MEIWKDIEGYVGYYQISNLGRLKSLDRYIANGNGKRLKKGMILKVSFQKNGYVNYKLWKNNKMRNKLGHRLVAKAFIPNPKNKKEVNHIDGIKTNNVVSNLEWNTRKENCQHSYDNGLQLPKKSKITYDIFSKIIRDIAKGKLVKDVLVKYGCSKRIYYYRLKNGYKTVDY